MNNTTTYYYRYTPGKQLGPTTWRMATLEVFDGQGKPIGGYSWTRQEPSEADQQYMLKEIIREHGQRKAFAKWPTHPDALNLASKHRQ